MSTPADRARRAPRPRAPDFFDYPRPSVAVDLVIFTILAESLHLLLIRRGEPPFEDRWALPGGFLRVGMSADDQGEDLDDAAARELAEETGLPPGAHDLVQLRVFGRPGRDPRGRVLSVAYAALIRPTHAPLVRSGGDARAAAWVPVDAALTRPLAFDHREIVRYALDDIRARLDRSDVAFRLVPETFTVGELRAVHDVILGAESDPGNFRRRFVRLVEDGIVEEAPGRRITGRKPAKVYRWRGRPVT
jgi:8-oxo-dGTP diphosphatase